MTEAGEEGIFNLEKDVAVKLGQILTKQSVNVNAYFQEKCIFL